MLPILSIIISLFWIQNIAFAKNYALLVGVSDYPSLSKSSKLKGTVNDVRLLKKILHARGFKDKNIFDLSGKPETKNAATRQNIIQHFEHLGQMVSKDDFIFLYFSGHGAQQPVNKLTSSNQSGETDGLDEVFLPLDTGKWTDEIQTVENAIIDDDFNLAITKIRDKGAFVWLVMDSCHSGTMTRGAHDDEITMRYVNAEKILGIPRQAINDAQNNTITSRGIGITREKDKPAMNINLQNRLNNKNKKSQSQKQANDKSGGFVAFYAAQPSELTPEMLLPKGSRQHRKKHGLFTFTLASVVTQYPNITYKQLAEQIHNEYNIINWTRTSPMVEGNSLNAPIFGIKSNEANKQWKLNHSDDGLELAAGQMNRIKEGSILAVYANAITHDKKVIGYVEVDSADLFYSHVNLIEFNKMAAAKLEDIPEQAYARLIQSPFSLELVISKPSIDKCSPKETCIAQAKRVDELFVSLNKEIKKHLKIKWVENNQEADIKLLIAEKQLWLLPPSGEWNNKSYKDGKNVFHTKSISRRLSHSDDKLIEILSDDFKHIAKVTNLMKLTETMSDVSNSDVINSNFSVKLKKKSTSNGANRIKIQPWLKPELHHGDKITFTVENIMQQPIDLTILHIDNAYGITPLFPAEGYSGIIAKGEKHVINGGVNSKTSLGLDRFIVIAVPVKPNTPSMSFTYLAQNSLFETRGKASSSTPTSPLKTFMDQIAFQDPEVTSRGFSQQSENVLDKAVIQVFSWKTVK